MGDLKRLKIKLREREAESNKKMQEKFINDNVEKAKTEKRELQYKAFLKLRNLLNEVVLYPGDQRPVIKSRLFERVGERR